MKTYRLPCDWQISTPDHWQGEYEEHDGQCVFYPDNSDLTVRITPFQAAKDGPPAPMEVMENAYIRTIPASAKLRDVNLHAPDGFAVRMYENTAAEWFGTKRLKAPEEYDKGSVIDEQTNIFTLGALLFEFFGTFSEEEISRRYQDNRFSPCLLSNWQLNKESYEVAKKAVSLNKNSRYPTFAEFFGDWKKAVERIRINE